MAIDSYIDAQLNLKGYLFDLDGVLWLDKAPIPGAREALLKLRNHGKQVMFVSNTSSRSRSQCLDQFSRMGMPIDSKELFLASEETASHIAKLKPGAVAYVLGSRGLFAELEKSGIEAKAPNDADPTSVDFVVIGKDKTIDYEKLTRAFRAIRAGAKFVAVNCDSTVPGADGLEPGAGALVAAISNMIGRSPDITVGKPGTLLLELALEYSGLAPEECAMVGDTIDVDIAAGKQLGMKTILVLSGNASKEDILSVTGNGELKPDVVIPSVKSLITMSL